MSLEKCKLMECILMNISIDYTKREPIYEQIVREVEKLITLGVLTPGSQIPSTVKKAYDMLEENGLIISKSTKGTFISDDVSMAKKQKIEELMEKIQDIIKELESYGLTREEIINRLK